MVVALKNLYRLKICKLFAMVLDFITIEFYGKSQKLLWIFGYTNTCIIVGYFKNYHLKKITKAWLMWI